MKKYETAYQRYVKKTIKAYMLNANRNTDPDIITFMEGQENKQATLKQAVRLLIQSQRQGA